MKYNKIISKGIILSFVSGLLMPVNSSASTFTEDTRYEIFDGNNISVSDILEDENTNTKIKGNSIVNSIGEPDLAQNCTVAGNAISYKYQTGKSMRVYFKNSTIKENTTYTVFANIAKNTLRRTDGVANVIKFNLNNYNYIDSGAFMIKEGEVGLIKRVLTTKDTITRPYLETVLNSVYEADGEFEIKDIIVVEGDYSDLKFEYFNSIKSGFEEKLVTQEQVDSGQEDKSKLGKYKVEYKVTGKNMLKVDYDNLRQTNNGVTLTVRDDGALVFNGTSSNAHTKFILNTEPLPDGDYVFTNRFSSTAPYLQFIGRKVDGGIDYLTGNFNIDNSKYTSSHIEVAMYPNTVCNDFVVYPQIESGSKTSGYEPYKEFIATGYLNTPLKEWDTIEYIDGKATHVKRTGEVTLNGTEFWSLQEGATLTDSMLFQHPVDNLYIETNGYATPKIVCDKYNLESHAKLYVQDKEGIANVERTSSIRIRINKSKMATQDVTGFKNWLRDNPVKVLYMLDNPIYEPISMDLNVPVYKGATHISNSSNIPINMEVIIDRVANRARDAVKYAKDNPSIESLAQARYWSNLMNETLLKDDFQNNINSITSVNDLFIEPKTVTANADVYIKMKNSLGLSIDTNAITFNDFDATESMEIKEAVKLNVFSSIPYKITVSLEDELYNADKTSKINKSALNIKLSDDVSYKGFLDIKDPIILKDNIDGGIEDSYGIDLRLNAASNVKADVYKTSLKFEVEQK